MKRLPNILSGIRIPLSISLLLFVNNKIYFLTTYLICFLTDMADGYLARRLNCSSELGVKLDGLGDAFFAVSAVICTMVYFRGEGVVTRYVIIGLVILAAQKLLNLFLTRIKFKQWNSAHNLLAKYMGGAGFIAMPLCRVLDYVPAMLFPAVIACIWLAFVDETFILIRSKEYDPDTKSMFSVNKQLKTE